MASADDVENLGEVASKDLLPSQPAKNAFTELMQPKPKPKADLPTPHTTFYGRDGLAAYTEDPTQFPQSRVVYHNDDFVVINDLYPKSVVHMLILPRDKRKSVMHPTDAFDDPDFLAICRAEEKKVRQLAASELRRQLCPYSASDRAHFEAMDSDEPPEDERNLPSGRKWEREIMSGIHANPSMNHLHIHVLSRDMHSEKMKKWNHYQSFTTDFFTRLDEFPLAADDHRRMYKHFPEELVCWRCGRGYGKRFMELKRHLAQEFEQWRAE